MAQLIIIGHQIASDSFIMRCPGCGQIHHVVSSLRNPASMPVHAEKATVRCRCGSEPHVPPYKQ